LVSMFRGMRESFKGMPIGFYILIFVQCMVWVGNTVWGNYGQVWFTNSVFPGDSEAALGSVAHDNYVAGSAAFSTAGQFGSVFNLVLSFLFMGLGFTSLPSKFIYSPCLVLTTIVCFFCAFVVGHSRVLAMTCFIISNVGLTAAASLPFGIVAVWNQMKEENTGEAGSVAVLMAILNCCVTVGQQLATIILTALEGPYSVAGALKGLFIISMVANGLAAIATLFISSTTVSKAPQNKTEGSHDLRETSAAHAASELA